MDISTATSYAISKLVPGAKFVIINRVTPEGIIGDMEISWKDDNITKPTDEAIATEVKAIMEKDSLVQYKRNREHEYPSMEEQADMQYWDQINGTTTWVDAISAIKNKYPKGVK